MHDIEAMFNDSNDLEKKLEKRGEKYNNNRVILGQKGLDNPSSSRVLHDNNVEQTFPVEQEDFPEEEEASEEEEDSLELIEEKIEPMTFSIAIDDNFKEEEEEEEEEDFESNKKKNDITLYLNNLPKNILLIEIDNDYQQLIKIIQQQPVVDHIEIDDQLYHLINIKKSLIHENIIELILSSSNDNDKQYLFQITNFNLLSNTLALDLLKNQIIISSKLTCASLHFKKTLSINI